MIEWYKQYIEAGDEFIPHNLVVRVDITGLLIAIEQHEEAHRDHQFGGKYVGTYITKKEGAVLCHSPVYLEEGQNRFYHIKSRTKETRENKDG